MKPTSFEDLIAATVRVAVEDALDERMAELETRIAELQPAAPAPTEERSEFLSQRELANLLCISIRSVRRLWRAERLPEPVTVGTRPRWRRNDIDTWLQAQREEKRAT